MDTQTLLNTVYRLENTEILNFSKHINLFRLMNPFQYINKIFCTLLFFATGNKSYSQREIHPLEPMFTYNYALKYYIHKPVRDFFMNEFDGNVEFWMIENFKSLSGVSNIEQQFLRNYRYDNKYLIFRNVEKDIKYKYFYNAETGFLEKSQRFQETTLNDVGGFIDLKEFFYFFDEQFTTIEVNRFVDEPAIDTLNYKYVYESGFKKRR